MRGITIREVEGGHARRAPTWQVLLICALAALSIASTSKLWLDARKPDHVVAEALALLQAPDVDERAARESLAILHRAVQPSLAIMLTLAAREDAVGANARDYLEHARRVLR